MRPEVLEQKTAVFSFGSLAVEEPRSYDMDEPTRQLPLIAGRFAGREWDVEELQREEAEKKAARREKDRRWFMPFLGAAAAVMLLVGSLTGQAALVDAGEKAAAADREIASLSLERDALRLEYARSGIALEMGETERAAVFETVQTRQDKATVLGVRRGHELDRFWDSVVDVLGASFH